MAGNSDGKDYTGLRRGPGKPFKPGQSGNPGGRPKGSEGLAKHLRIRLRNGKAGADSLIAIAQGTETRTRFLVTKDGVVPVDEAPSFAESIAAWKVLFDRMHGTAQKFIEVSGPGGSPLAVVLDNLEHVSDEDLDALEGIAQRAVHGGTGPGEGAGGEGEEGEAPPAE